MLFQIALIGVLIYLYCWHLQYKRRNWPPGPFPYPLIGNIIEAIGADKLHYIGFMKMAQKYGNIFSFKLGVMDYVIVNGYKEVKELQSSTEIDDRIIEKWILDKSYGSDKYGVLFSTGNAWKNSRKYAIRTLKDFGFGKRNEMDEILAEEFEFFVQRIQRTVKENNGTLTIDLTFNVVFVNIIYSFLTGTRFSQDDPKLQELVLLSNEFLNSQNIGGSILGAYPFLQTWAPELSGFGRTHRANVLMLDYFKSVVDTIREQGDYKNNPSNFVEKFLQRIDKGAKHDDYDEPIFTDKNLICTLNDFFFAGSETSSTITSFAIRHFLQSPQHQIRIQQEVDRVVGSSRRVTLADRPSLKYTEAFVNEVLRFNTIVPIGPRRPASDMKIGSYLIPKGTTVFCNYYSGNMDKLLWGDPEEFRPERFLDQRGEIINADKISSFAFGKRDCLGQSIAKNSLVMVLAVLAQHFTFQVDPATGLPGYENTNNITVSPLPFNTLVKDRR